MICTYRRVSTQRQDISLDAQQDRIAAYLNGNVPDKWADNTQDFVDDGISGSVPLGNRPSGRVLIETAKAGDVIVVAKLDRLFCSVADAAVTLAEWAKHDIQLVALAEGFDMTSPYGRAMAQMASVFAELERAMIGERTKAALQAKRRRGERVGTVPYGFECVGGRLIENARELEVVAQMRQRRASGMTLRDIAAKLNEDCVPAKRGGVWRAQSVASILKRQGA